MEVKSGYRRLEGLNEITQAVKEGLKDVKVSAELDDPIIDSIKDILDERLVKKVWITRADYDALVVKDPEVLYIVIESQSNS